MKLYQFRLYDAAGNVTRRHPLRLPTGAAAMKVAQHLFAGGGGAAALEIWHHNRAVHRIN